MAKLSLKSTIFRFKLQGFLVAPDAKKAFASNSKLNSSKFQTKASEATMENDLPGTDRVQHNIPEADTASASMNGSTNGTKSAVTPTPPTPVKEVSVSTDSQSSMAKLSNGISERPVGGTTSTTDSDQSTSLKAAEAEQEAVMPNGVDVPIIAENSLVKLALAIIADETGLEVSDLHEDTDFADLGIDSLMSLVLAQKCRSGIGVEVRDSLFIEFPQIGDLCRWLEKQCTIDCRVKALPCRTVSRLLSLRVK